MSTRFAKSLAAALLCAGLLPAPQAQAFSLGGLFGSPVDAELAAQVPQDKRAAINAADYELACANQDVELAKLKEELADKQDDMAALGTKLAKSQARGAEIRLDIAKMEGIIANQLGNDEENQKILADLKSDRSKNESDTIGYKAKIDTANLYVRDWTQRVANKEKSVAEFKSRRSGAATPPPAAATAAPVKADTAATGTPDPAATGDDATVIINKEPGAAPEKPAATPEADLNN